jgi:hypothetical protein
LPRKAIPTVASARQLPPNKPATEAPADRSARWPVLARIAELRRDDEQPARKVASTEATYRIDSPHRVDLTAAPAAISPPVQPISQPLPTQPLPASTASVVSRSKEASANPKVTPTKAQRKAEPRQTSSARPVRAAVDAWQAAKPHQELIRFAAMLALMVAAGMSAVFIMRDRLQPSAETSSPVAATTGQPKTSEPAVHHAELEPKLEPQLTPETDTSSLEPTATGPLAPPAKPVMAVNTVEPPAVAPYPTTSLAEVTLPPQEEFALPKIQTKDPEVARSGDANSSKVR